MKLVPRIALSILVAAASTLAAAQSAATVQSAVAATTVAKGPGQLTLQKARELTLSRSATLQKANLAVKAASLAATAQGYDLLPSVSVSASGAYPFETSPAIPIEDNVSGSAKLAASELVFDGGRTSALVKKSNYATLAEEETLRSTRLTLIGESDSAYFGVLQAGASVDAATSDLAAARQRQDIAQAKLEAGTLARSGFLQTQADTASSAAKLILAKGSLAVARAKLASLTGAPIDSALEPVDFTSYDALLAKLSALQDPSAIEALVSSVVALARANSPAISGFALSGQGARAASDAAKRAAFPSLSAGLSQSIGYGNSSGLSQSVGGGNSSGLSLSGSLSLSATMSLDFWVLKNGIDSAGIAVAQADADAAQGEADLEFGVAQALYNWLSSAASISSSAEALDYAQSNYESFLEQFKLSSATTSDLATAEATVSADETALIAARYGFLSNLSTLSGLAGLEDGAKIVALVQ